MKCSFIPTIFARSDEHVKHNDLNEKVKILYVLLCLTKPLKRNKNITSCSILFCILSKLFNFFRWGLRWGDGFLLTSLSAQMATTF